MSMYNERQSLQECVKDGVFGVVDFENLVMCCRKRRQPCTPFRIDGARMCPATLLFLHGHDEILEFRTRKAPGPQTRPVMSVE